jgi:cytochrome c oxidase cbb3-type subunit 3
MTGRGASIAIVIGALVLAAGASARLLASSRVDAALLRSDPDLITGNPRLTARAMEIGRKAYDSHCVACHGANLGGSTARGIPNLADGVWLYGSGEVSEIERTIAHGIRSQDPQGWNLAQMPAFGREVPSTTYQVPPLRPEQIDDVTAFVVALAEGGTSAPAAKRGARVFDGPGACIDCHSTDARGDTSIGAPDLTSRVRLYGDGSPAAVRESIAYGRHGACPAWVNRLSNLEIRALAVYLHVRSRRPAT